MNKIITILLTFLFLMGCNYTPIYSGKNFDFKLKNIINAKKNQLDFIIERRLQNFSNQESQKIISLKVDTQKEINILSKDVINDLSENPIQDDNLFVKCDIALSFLLSQSINKLDENINSFSKGICDYKYMIRSLKNIKLAHLIEKKNNFKVKQISKKIEDETISKDLPLIFVLTVLLSYYFFKPLRKFLKLNKK